jgi:hypothetical protein
MVIQLYGNRTQLPRNGHRSPYALNHSLSPSNHQIERTEGNVGGMTILY